MQRKKFRISPRGILYYVKGDRWLMVVPKVLQKKIIQENYDVLAIGHVGLNRTLDHIKRAFWWRGMWSTMEEYVRSCPVCQLVKSDHRKKVGALQQIPLPEGKWQQITTDLVTDLPESERKPPSPYLWIVSQRWFTLLYVPRKSQRKNTPSSSLIMCLNIIVYQKLLSLTGIQDSPVAFGRNCSKSSEWISGSVRPSLRRRMASRR